MLLNQFELRPAEIKDINALMAIENECFINPWKKDQFLYELTDNPCSNVAVLEFNGMIVGFYDYWHTFDSATICQIAVTKQFRKLGLAYMMMEDIIKDCYAKRVINITLEVRKSNAGAIRLYEKNGFEKILVKPAYYSDGEDALYMVRKVEI
jgi:ribosomal-protein-alanine N-acetyltransferase